MIKGTFSSVFAVFDYLKSKGWGGLYHTPPRFEVIQFSDNQLIACPMPMSPLYRGQNAIFNPCKPSLYRRNWTKEQLFERQIQLNEFKAILQDNPQVKDLESNGLLVNYEALAQHYGIPTSMMDMTNSSLVAAFFATTEYDPITDHYRPIVHTISKGIIYFSPTGDMLNFSNRNRIWPIGQEVLKRPGEQRAYAMTMEKETEFNMMAFEFWHDSESSLRIWEMTNRGEMFFPYDPMAEKVRAMKKCRIYSLGSIRKAYVEAKNIADSYDKTKHRMEQLGCTFVDKLPFAYTDDEINRLTVEYHKMYPDSFK